jgi:hypothetical protein
MPKRKYSLAFKQEVLDYIQVTGATSYAAWQYFCQRDRFIYTQSMFNKWNKNRDLIESQVASGYAEMARIRGGGRKPLLATAEALIRDEVNDILEKRSDFKVTRQFIRKRALEIARSLGIKDFIASSHWIKCFMTRNGFELMPSKAFAQFMASQKRDASSSAGSGEGYIGTNEPDSRDEAEDQSSQSEWAEGDEDGESGSDRAIVATSNDKVIDNGVAIEPEDIAEL